jgi:iron(III) transport system permease protein
MFLRVAVFPAAVFARLGGVDYAPGEAFALVLPLVPLALLILALERRFVGTRGLAVSGLRGLARGPLPLRRWRGALSAAAWGLTAVSLLPLLALALRAGPGGLALLPQWIGGAAVTSVLVAVSAAFIVAALGLVIGHAAARRLPGATWLDGLAVLAFVMPAAVLGVGLIAVWNRAPTAFVYGSLAILVIGAGARYAIIGVRTVAAVVVQSPRHLEEAAAAAGAGFARRLLRIVLPVHRRGVLFAWLLTVVFCLRDLETAVLFYPPGSEPLPVRIFTLEANGPPPVVAALALAQVALTAAVLGIGAWLLRRRRTS